MDSSDWIALSGFATTVLSLLINAWYNRGRDRRLGDQADKDREATERVEMEKAATSERIERAKSMQPVATRFATSGAPLLRRSLRQPMA